MNCLEVKRRLNEYLDGELEPFLQEKVGLHLNSCLTCRLEHEQLSKAIRLMQMLKTPPLPRDYSKK